MIIGNLRDEFPKTIRCNNYELSRQRFDRYNISVIFIETREIVIRVILN